MKRNGCFKQVIQCISMENCYLMCKYSAHSVHGMHVIQGIQWKTEIFSLLLIQEIALWSGSSAGGAPSGWTNTNSNENKTTNTNTKTEMKINMNPIKGIIVRLDNFICQHLRWYEISNTTDQLTFLSSQLKVSTWNPGNYTTLEV